jgi:hypothetical protein
MTCCQKRNPGKAQPHDASNSVTGELQNIVAAVSPVITVAYVKERCMPVAREYVS